jgi:hypothetical protein
MDAIGKKVLLKILSGILIFLGILFMNGIISISIIGNGLYDSLVLIILGILIFIIGQTFSGPKTRSGY